MDEIAAVSQTMFLNAFSWIKSFVFCFQYLRRLFPREK